jgi:hypothetical protein
MALWWVLRRRAALHASDYGLSLLWAAVLIAPFLATAALVDHQSPSLATGLLVKAGLACLLVVAVGAPLALKAGFPPRAAEARRLMSRPFRGLWALDAEGEAR